MMPRPQNLDGAQGDAYLRSPGRLAFIRKVMAMRNAEIAAEGSQHSKPGTRTNHTYSLTREQSSATWHPLRG